MFDLGKSIDFLLENGRDVIRYRLHKEILHDLNACEEQALLERVMQTPDYQLLLTHVKPNGYIGTGMHSWEKFKSSQHLNLHTVTDKQILRTNHIILIIHIYFNK